MAARRKFKVEEHDLPQTNFNCALLDGWRVDQQGSRIFVRHENGKRKGPFLLESQAARAVPDYTHNRQLAFAIARKFDVVVYVAQIEDNPAMRLVTFDEKVKYECPVEDVSALVVVYVLENALETPQNAPEAAVTTKAISEDVNEKTDVLKGE